MISEKIQSAVNTQITAEMWSANLYLSMAYYLQREGFEGFAHWMKKQSAEELEHAYKLADFLTNRGGVVKIDKIDVVPQGWGSVAEVFDHVYKHECHVSSLIDELVALAREEKDNASENFFMWYVNEQVEEESNVLGIVEKLKMIDGNISGIMFMNNKLGQR